MLKVQTMPANQECMLTAAIAAILLHCCCVCDLKVFDRPFLFFLVEGSTQSVLFQGAVTDPTAGGAGGA